MDKFGVPKKINRHVMKAIYQLSDQGLDSLDLLNICHMVEFNMRNNVPVANLLGEVRRSLQNLSNLGVIKKKGSLYFRSYDNNDSFPSTSRKNIGIGVSSRKIRDQNKSTLNPNNRKRRMLSEESLPEKNPKSSIKRFRTSKSLSRKGNDVHLPNVRMHNLMIPTQYYHPSSGISGVMMKQDMHSNSSSGYENSGYSSEDENVEVCPSKTESKLFSKISNTTIDEERELANLLENTDDKPETASNSGNPKTDDSQDDKQTKSDKVSNEKTSNNSSSSSEEATNTENEHKSLGNSSNQKLDSQNDQLTKREKLSNQNESHQDEQQGDIKKDPESHESVRSQ